MFTFCAPLCGLRKGCKKYVASLLQRDNRRLSNMELFHEQTAGRFGSCCHPSPIIFRGSFWAKMSLWHLEEHFFWSKKFKPTLVVWLWLNAAGWRGEIERRTQLDRHKFVVQWEQYQNSDQSKSIWHSKWWCTDYQTLQYIFQMTRQTVAHTIKNFE